MQRQENDRSGLSVGNSRDCVVRGGVLLPAPLLAILCLKGIFISVTICYSDSIELIFYLAPAAC
jgi:hypothetical protein